MAELMKAALVREFGASLCIEEVRVPVPVPGRVRVKAAACGVCRTDLHAASGDWSGVAAAWAFERYIRELAREEVQ